MRKLFGNKSERVILRVWCLGLWSGPPVVSVTSLSVLPPWLPGSLNLWLPAPCPHSFLSTSLKDINNNLTIDILKPYLETHLIYSFYFTAVVAFWKHFSRCGILKTYQPLWHFETFSTAVVSVVVTFDKTYYTIVVFCWRSILKIIWLLCFNELIENYHSQSKN